MTFKENLMASLKDSIQFANEGYTPDESVVKSAQKHNLNLEQTNRLVEVFNTAKTINMMKKAEDRTMNFPLADKDGVVKLMYSNNETEKKASCVSHDYSFYDSAPSDFCSESNFEKAAESEVASDSGYSLETLGHEMVRNVRMCRQTAKEAEEAASAIKSEMITCLYKLAESLKKGYEPEKRYARFCKIAEDNSIVIENLGKVMPESFIGFEDPMCNGCEVLDDSDLTEELNLADLIKNLSGKEKNFKIVSVSWNNKADDIEKKFMDALDDGTEPDVADMITLDGNPEDDTEEDSDEKDEEDSEDDSDNEEKDEKSAQDLSMALVPWVTAKAVTKGVENGSFIPSSALEDIFKRDETKNDKKINDTILNLKRSRLISDLASNDPILSEADPESIAQAYQTIVDTAPHVSLQKEVVRAMLRQSVNSLATSPYDVQQWAALNSSLENSKRTPELSNTRKNR